MSLKNLDLIATTSTAILVIFFSLSAVLPEPFKIAVGLPFVFFLNGYSIMLALFPQNLQRSLTGFTFTAGLSLTTSILGGFLLNLTPWGLQAGSWAFMLGAITIGASGVALFRRNKSLEEKNERLNLPFSKSNFSQLILIGLAVILAFAAILIARTGAEEQAYPGFTQFWLLPPLTGSPDTVCLGINNKENAELKYKVEVKIGNNTLYNLDHLELKSGQQWQTTLEIPEGQYVRNNQIEALLYRLDNPESIYRRITLDANAISKTG